MVENNFLLTLICHISSSRKLILVIKVPNYLFQNHHGPPLSDIYLKRLNLNGGLGSMLVIMH